MPKPSPTSSTRWHQERWRSRHGINLAFGENGKVALVVTDKGTYPADIVTLCVNFKPNSALYEGADFTVPPNRALVVNHHQETSKPGVYAIGNCSSCFDNAKDGERAYIALATHAVCSGMGHSGGRHRARESR